jgi:hypothetical protein
MKKADDTTESKVVNLTTADDAGDTVDIGIRRDSAPM